MSKASGYIHLLLILSAEQNPKPLVKGGGAGAHIHGNIEDFSFNDANELALGVIPDLKMKAAQYAARAAGLVVLNKFRVDAGFGKRPLVPRLKKVAALIAENPGREDLKTGNWGWGE